MTRQVSQLLLLITFAGAPSAEVAAQSASELGIQGDLKRIDAACVTAGRRSKRVLVVLDLRVDPSKDRELRALLRREYEVITIGDPEGARTFAGRVSPGASAVPALAVVESGGRSVALMSAKSLDRASVLEFLRSSRAAPPDAETVLAVAQKQARAEGKLLFVVVTEAGHGKSERLDEFLARPWIAATFAKGFVVVALDEERMENGAEVARRLGRPGAARRPWYVFADAELTTLPAGVVPGADEPSSHLGLPAEERERELFARRLSAVSRELTAEDLWLIVASLKIDSTRSADPVAGASEPPAGVAVYPDGSWLPLLNGIETAPGPCPWPKEIPYAPVTGIVKGEGGILWFGHADGSMSCVQMVQTANGLQAGWAVGNPTRSK